MTFIALYYCITSQVIINRSQLLRCYEAHIESTVKLSTA
jgi:hypothetical protein